MSVYVGIFLIALATLGVEISLTRLLSVTTWYHLAFFAISAAMLGMTAGAVTVHLRPGWFERHNRDRHVARACLGFALAAPLSMVLLCLLPLRIPASTMDVAALAVATLCACLPFYFAGIAVAAVLTRWRRPIGRLYAADLAGAALGCLAVLAGVELLDVPSLILVFAALGAAAAASFAWSLPDSRPWRTGGAACVLLVVLAATNAAAPAGIAPLMVKGEVEDPADRLLETWNSFSRVVVHRGGWSVPQLWAPSPRMPRQPPVMQYYMDVDGDAGTTVRRFESVRDLQHLAYDVTNVAYHLRRRGGACVIGVGGGRDVQSALLFGHRRVLGLEVNPVFVELLQDQFREFAGLAEDERVRLVVDEARSHLSRTDERFAVIQMSLIDTWAATGAGAFSLSENALYTVEAWRVFLDRLADDGLFTVSRWYSPEDLGETGRVCSLAVATLLEAGVKHPARHLAMFTTGRIATTVVSRRPFSDEDLRRLREVGARFDFELVVAPDVAPQADVLRAIVGARSRAELRAAVAGSALNYEPPTDENPYFFNMLRLGRLSEAFQASPGIARGNLTATITLLVLLACLAVLALLTVVLPLLLDPVQGGPRAASSVSWSGAAYFSLIGAGFMFVELALIQRLSVFLGHPVYALGILLFTLIATTGCGALLSERLSPRGRGAYTIPLIAAGAILTAAHLLPAVLGKMVSAVMSVKIVVAVALTAPLGLLLGLFFPIGMRLARQAGAAADTPWYWALNGVLGVLCSALTVLISIYFGISTSLYIAAICYVALVPCVRGMHRLAARQVQPPLADNVAQLPSRKLAV